jgi:uncharacterized membrane protein AbrB (regulator of aidB expression)
MIGPLFSIALLRVAGAALEVPLPVRYAGQWIIGTSLGLYFTPHVIHEVAGLWYLLVAGAVFAIALGYVSGLALARMAGSTRRPASSRACRAARPRCRSWASASAAASTASPRRRACAS